jgi:hypothetical protein
MTDGGALEALGKKPMFGMRRREFITLIGSAAAWPVAARAQQPTKKMPRIGWLVTGSPASYRFSLAAFREGLRALNYVEGSTSYLFGGYLPRGIYVGRELTPNDEWKTDVADRLLNALDFGVLLRQLLARRQPCASASASSSK